MENRWDILVVSGRFENKRMLLHILYDLPVFVFTASTVRQAHEVLASRPIRLLFCEEHLADGSYRDLLDSIHRVQPTTQLVLMLSTGEWQEYLDAMSLGAREVIRCPLQPTDVELVLIRAARDSVPVLSHDERTAELHGQHEGTYSSR
jgi:DNA-binding NtrC family response regulator